MERSISLSPQVHHSPYDIPNGPGGPFGDEEDVPAEDILPADVEAGGLPEDIPPRIDEPADVEQTRYPQPEEAIPAEQQDGPEPIPLPPAQPAGAENTESRPGEPVEPLPGDAAERTKLDGEGVEAASVLSDSEESASGQTDSEGALPGQPVLGEEGLIPKPPDYTVASSVAFPGNSSEVLGETMAQVESLASKGTFYFPKGYFHSAYNDRVHREEALNDGLFKVSFVPAGSDEKPVDIYGYPVHSLTPAEAAALQFLVTEALVYYEMSDSSNDIRTRAAQTLGIHIPDSPRDDTMHAGGFTDFIGGMDEFTDRLRQGTAFREEVLEKMKGNQDFPTLREELLSEEIGDNAELLKNEARYLCGRFDALVDEGFQMGGQFAQAIADFLVLPPGFKSTFNARRGIVLAQAIYTEAFNQASKLFPPEPRVVKLTRNE